MSAAPRPKVAAVGVAGSAAAVLAFLLSEFAGVDLPPGIEAETAVLIAFAAGYLKSG